MVAFLFFFFAVLALVGALGMLTARSPVASALWMVLNLFAIACLYLTLNAQFIAIIQILVYAGAIMVLFLFVIMLLNLSETPRLGAFDWKKGVAFLLGVAVLAQILFIVALGLDALPEPVTAVEAAATGTAGAIGLVLFTEYAFTLQIIGVLLLAATIGAVLLAKKRFV
ncbi:MAG: NADH-quinone oxidoreductase subunit J [Rhodothermales bacterium]|nr:NADH-quinone oxidoreductase subunit J [Rhodothermales bacterium]